MQTFWTIRIGIFTLSAKQHNGAVFIGPSRIAEEFRVSKKRSSVHFAVVSRCIDRFLQYLEQGILRYQATQKVIDLSIEPA